MAQELLLNVYEEYKKYCEKLKRDLHVVHSTDPNAIIVNGMLQIKKTEIVTGRRTQIQQPANQYDSAEPTLNQQAESFVPSFQTNSKPFTPNF